MSVENKIREFLNKTTVAEAYPGFGKNKEEEAPMQGSSQKPTTQNLDKGAGADAAMKAGDATSLAAGSGPMDKKNPLQGSSNPNPEQEDLGTDEPGKVAAQKMSKTTKHPMGHGAGEAKNFTTVADPASVVNQPNSKGNVYREDAEVEGEEDEFISEEEFNALSPEQQAEYELVEVKHDAEKMEDEDEDEENEEDEKEMKKKKMMKMMKMKEDAENDVKALFGEEANLSEEFKNKAASLFEAVVTARVAHIREEIENEVSQQAAELVESYVEGIVEKVDEYMNYVVEQWLEQNQVEVVNGLRNEITEDFISGLRNLFAENYIEIPEEKYDVLGEMQSRIEELENALNEKVEQSNVLSNEVVSMKRENIISSVSEGLAQTEVEKFKSLVEEISFEDEASFADKLTVIKENYFPKAAVITENEDISSEDAVIETSSSVMKYAEVLNRTRFTK